jgi:polyhydroxyalkanoate synthesis regulator phasin
MFPLRNEAIHPEDKQMTQNDTAFKTLIQDTYNQAQGRIVELAEKAQAHWKDGSNRSKEAIEDWLEQLSGSKLLEKIKNHETLQPGSLKDLLRPVGFVTREDISELTEELQTLRNNQADLAKQADLVQLREELAALKGENGTTPAAKTAATTTRKKPAAKKSTKKSTTKARKSSTNK